MLSGSIGWFPVRSARQGLHQQNNASVPSYNGPVSELLKDLDLEEPPTDSVPEPNRIEQVIVLLADAVWAVVGLVLWIPQIVRVVITTAIRLVHSALTRQPIDSIRGPIRRVSRFYVDGFLTPGRSKPSGAYASREARLGRFLIEAVWVIVVWMLVLRLVSQQVFDNVWSAMASTAAKAWHLLAALAMDLVARLPEGFAAIVELGTAPRLILGILVILVFVGGLVLGLRRR